MTSRHLQALLAEVILVLGLLLVPQADCEVLTATDIPVWGYRTVRTYPHDSEAFTQGLVHHQGVLYESAGLYGRSSLRKVALETGRVLQQHNLPGRLFAEGLALWKDRLVQLTWKAGLATSYDPATFRILATHRYDGEGWGLTQDGSRLIMSDGTSYLRYFDPETFKQTGLLQVLEGERPLKLLNELEWVRGEIWANVWYSDRIARICPFSGKVLGWIDLSGLRREGAPADREKVLNGIAYDASSGRLFVTGKLWPVLFEIEVAPPASSPPSQ